MAVIFKEGEFDNAYITVGDYLYEYIRDHDEYISDIIVLLHTTNLGFEKCYASLDEFCTSYNFDTDWYEGGDIEVIGYTKIEDVPIRRMIE